MNKLKEVMNSKQMRHCLTDNKSVRQSMFFYSFKNQKLTSNFAIIKYRPLQVFFYGFDGFVAQRKLFERVALEDPKIVTLER